MYTYLRPKTEEELFDSLYDKNIKLSQIAKFAQMDGSIGSVAMNMYLTKFGLPTTEEELLRIINDPSTKIQQITFILSIRQQIFNSLLHSTGVNEALTHRLFPEMYNTSEKFEKELGLNRDTEIQNHYVHLFETKD